MSKAVGIICKLKTLLPKEILLKLYYALVHPQLLYGLLVGSFISQKNKCLAKQSCQTCKGRKILRQSYTILLKTLYLKVTRLILDILGRLSLYTF